MIQETIKPLVNELRIGNWVETTTDADRLVDVGMKIRQVTAGDIFSIWGGQKCKPVPLTSDILLKVGFPKMNWSTYDDHDYFYDEQLGWGFGLYRIEKGYKLVVDTDRGPIGVGSTKILYVHQLQNLYWCLCGKELDIKL